MTLVEEVVIILRYPFPYLSTVLTQIDVKQQQNSSPPILPHWVISLTYWKISSPFLEKSIQHKMIACMLSQKTACFSLDDQR